jgi:outer membrane protein assembly factor BamA
MFLIAASLMLSPATFDAVSDARNAFGQDTVRVGRIILAGNTVTADRVILSLLGVRPGQRLRYAELEEGRRNLIRTGLFDNEEPATVEVVATKSNAPSRDVRVRVKETQAGSVVLGVGINSNPGIRGTLTTDSKP